MMGESRFDLGMEPSEHKGDGPYAGAWRHTLGPKGEGQMVFRIEAELKLAMLREQLDDERRKLCELQGRLDEAQWKIVELGGERA